MGPLWRRVLGKDFTNKTRAAACFFPRIGRLGDSDVPGHDSRARGLLGRPRLRAHAAVPHRARRGHLQSRDVPALPRPEAVAHRLRRAGDPPDRRALRREPVPLPALLPVPGDPQAGARGRARPLLRLARGDRDRPRRHDVRLVEDDWEQPTLGAWGLGWEVWFDGMEVTQFTYFQQLGGLDVELVPGRDHVRARAARDVPAGEAKRLRARVGAGRHLGRRLPRERAPVVGLQLRGGAGRRAHAPLRRARGRVRAACSSAGCRCRPTTRC